MGRCYRWYPYSRLAVPGIPGGPGPFLRCLTVAAVADTSLGGRDVDLSKLRPFILGHPCLLKSLAFFDLTVDISRHTAGGVSKIFNLGHFSSFAHNSPSTRPSWLVHPMRRVGGDLRHFGRSVGLAGRTVRL